MAQLSPEISSTTKQSASAADLLTLRHPTAEDGASIHALIDECKPLDTNSMYCNLLQASHFCDTAILAEKEGQIVGFISGYRIPNQPKTLFVWQVAVSSKARGLGLASRMLTTLIEQQNGEVNHLHTSITAGNDASWNTFRRLAKTLNAPLNESVLFDKAKHFDGHHDSEMLVEIGPF
ncbi:MAG: diaminobutyrate acetyltransferase [Oleibacter sp.]|nr:diaminobutyrate acetyltransferase [Thalassolituus sp.]